MTFPARFETVDLSDFSSFTFRLSDERGWRRWGDKRRSKGDGGG